MKIEKIAIVILLILAIFSITIFFACLIKKGKKLRQQNIPEFNEKYNIVVYISMYKNNKLISKSEKTIGHTTKEYDEYINDMLFKLKERNVYYDYISVNFYTSTIQIRDSDLHTNIIVKKQFK